MRESYTAGLLLWCADTEPGSSWGTVIYLNACWGLPNWAAVQAMKYGPAQVECDRLRLSGPRVGRGRGFVGGTHMWRSEEVNDLRGAVHICVVCSGTGSMPHSRNWCKRVSCTGRHQKCGNVWKVGGVGMDGELWKTGARALGHNWSQYHTCISLAFQHQWEGERTMCTWTVMCGRQLQDWGGQLLQVGSWEHELLK